MANKVKLHRLQPVVLRRKRAKIQKKWTEDENLKILGYLIETKSQGLVIEKPSARIYYEKLIEKTGIVDRNYDLIRNKVRNFHVKYKEALRWKEEVGKLISETEGEAKFHLAFKHRYPHFQYYKNIWGDISYLNAPYETDFPEVGIENAESFEYVIKDENESHHQYNPVMLEPPECFVPFENPSSLGSSDDSEIQASAGGDSANGIEQNGQEKLQYRLPFRSSLTGLSKAREDSVKEMFRLLQKQLEFDQQLCALETAQFDRCMAERRAERELERELKTKELEMRQSEIQVKSEIRKMELEVEKLKWTTQLELVKRNMQPVNVVDVHQGEI